MKTEILAYFSENWSGSKDELAEVIDALNIKTIKKGTILVQEGAVSTLCYYILKGCVRQYILEDGIEKTTAFYTENQAVVPFQTYLKGKPSNHFTVCLEDVTAIVGNPEEEKEMYRKFPNLESLTRTMIEQDFGKTQEEFANFVTSSPEKRYLDLMKNRPDLIQRVPQHQIASYLGVTPESLSRIRRRLAKK